MAFHRKCITKLCTQTAFCGIVLLVYWNRLNNIVWDYFTGTRAIISYRFDKNCFTWHLSNHFHHLVWKAYRRQESAIRIYFVCITPDTLSWHGTLARYIKLRVAHAPGMPGTVSLPLWVSDPDMHLGTCVTHVPWCVPGSLTSGYLWSRWRGKHSWHSPQFYVSGKRPLETHSALLTNV